MTEGDKDGLSATTYGPLEGWRPKKIIILLHGPDIPAAQMMHLAHLFAPHFPTVKFFAVEAPYVDPDHPERRVWLRSRDRTAASQVAALKEVTPAINRYIDEVLAEYEISERDIALVGFSEGAVAVLYAGLRRVQAVSGILCFAGCILDRNHLKEEIRSRPKVYLIQGDEDPYLPRQVVLDTIEVLMRSGVRVDSHFVRGKGHQIGKENLKYGSRFLAQLFGMHRDPSKSQDHPVRRTLNRIVASVHQTLYHE